jgi:hypothetical protein
MASFGMLAGDLDALTRFGERVGQIGSQRTLAKLNQELAQEAIVQARDGFREERDPYGKKWPEKVFPDGRKILRKSEKLYNGFKVLRADARGFEITNVEEHAKYTFGTGLWGPKKSRIYPKTAKALVIGGSQGRSGSTGQFTRNIAFRSIKGSPPRLIVPLAGKPSPIWQRAFKQRATKFLSQYFTKKR